MIPYFETIDSIFLKNRDRYITYKDILEEINGEEIDLNKVCMKDVPNYPRVKEYIKEIRAELKRLGYDFDYKNGKNSKEGLRYPEGLEDPMEEKRSARKKLRLKQLSRLIELSDGLMPDSWLADMLQVTIQSNKKQNSIIDFSHHLNYNRVELIPTFFNAIEKKLVLSFSYKPAFTQPAVNLYFHPYYIKEYDQAWFVFGRATDQTEEQKTLKYGIIGVERIEGDVVTLEPDVVKYVNKETDWKEHFSHIVGVSTPKKKPQKIEIEVLNEEIFNRFLTKPFPCQQIVQDYNKEKGNTGKILLKLIPNKELVSELIRFRSGIRILGDKEFLKVFKDEVQKLFSIYFQ